MRGKAISVLIGGLFLCVIVTLLGAGTALAGEVVAYVSMTERDIAPMQEAFKKATGLDVKVVVIPIGQATTRIKVEAGRP